MAYNDALGILYLFLLIALIVYLAMRRYQSDRSEEPDTDFACFTVREQLAIANRTAETLGEAEQLITDMQESRAEDVMMLHIEWIGRDAQQHEITLGCDGYNTATACMIEIGEREVNDLKNELACQCAILSDCGRHRQKRGQIDAVRRGEAIEYDEAMHALRSAYLDG